MSRKKFERFVKWCGPGGGSFGYEKEDEDRDGILWAAERIALLEKVIQDTIPPLKAREEEDGSTDYLIPELEAALRSLEGR
jgi:hypothetical protein